MADTKKTASKSKVTDKKVVKKDGKVIVTYKTPYKSALGTYPSKVRRIYDDKGNLIKGNQRVQGSYGSSYDIGIKGKKKEAPVKKEASKVKTPMVTGKNVTSKEGAAKIKGIVEDMQRPSQKKTTTADKNVRSKQDAAKIKGIVDGLQRPSQKKKTTKPKPVAPKMATTIGSAKVSVPSKGKVKIEANTGKPKSFTAPKTETKAKVQTAPKPASRPEPIKMELIPLKQVAQDLQDSRPKADLAPIKTPVAKTSAPVEESTGILARMKQRREDRKQAREYRKEARQAEKDAEKAETAKMKKGGMVKKYQDGGSKRRPGSKMIQKKPVNIQQNPITEKNRLEANPSVAKKQIVTMKTRFVYPGKSGAPSPLKTSKKGGIIKTKKK